MPKERTVLILEDQVLQRRALHRQLVARGFDVVSASDAAEAIRAVEIRAEPFDVVVLDMRLSDDPSQPTGADLALRFLQENETWRARRPEFLVNTVYSEELYYELALKLGAAAYLQKEKVDLPSVVRHVSVLALRRALSVDRRGAMQHIKAIAASSQGRSEAVRRFCAEVVCPELKDSLALPFLLLLSDETGHWGFSSRPQLPPRTHKAYEILQALCHGEAGLAEPWVFKAEQLKDIDSEFLQALRQLDRAVLVPFSGEPGLRLSVGVLPDHADVDAAKSLAEVIAVYLRPAVLRHLLEVTAAVAEFEERRRDVVRATAQFCLYVGQQQLAALEGAEDEGEIASKGANLSKLELLGSDLLRSGELLGNLAKAQPKPADTAEPVEMAAILTSAWRQVGRLVPAEWGYSLQVKGDCRVQGPPEYLSLAAARVLQWFAQRQGEAPSEERSTLSAECLETADGPQIVFRDQSRKLPETLRRMLFLPFASTSYGPKTVRMEDGLQNTGLHLALFLAKMLVEIGCGGLLEDQTEPTGEFGHQLVMQFPPTANSSSI